MKTKLGYTIVALALVTPILTGCNSSEDPSPSLNTPPQSTITQNETDGPVNESEVAPVTDEDIQTIQSLFQAEVDFYNKKDKDLTLAKTLDTVISVDEARAAAEQAFPNIHDIYNLTGKVSIDKSFYTTVLLSAVAFEVSEIPPISGEITINKDNVYRQTVNNVEYLVVEPEAVSLNNNIEEGDYILTHISQDEDGIWKIDVSRKFDDLIPDVNSTIGEDVIQILSTFTVENIELIQLLVSQQSS